MNPFDRHDLARRDELWLRKLQANDMLTELASVRASRSAEQVEYEREQYTHLVRQGAPDQALEVQRVRVRVAEELYEQHAEQYRVVAARFRELMYMPRPMPRRVVVGVAPARTFVHASARERRQSASAVAGEDGGEDEDEDEEPAGDHGGLS